MTISADQRLVNEAYAHLKSTGVKSARARKPSTDFCEYGGSGCAFAPAILPEKRDYADELESTAASIIRDNPDILHDWAKACDPDIARRVQICHDTCEAYGNTTFFDAFSERLKEVCKECNLDFPGDSE